MAYVPETEGLVRIYDELTGFSKEKLEVYSANGMEVTKWEDHFLTMAHAYTPHNTDTLPDIMFLKYWIIEYHNECIKQVLKK